MYIEAVDLQLTTDDGNKYGRYVSFVHNGQPRELNLIYGENTLGKSTLVKSIVYALGGEDLYGKSTANDSIFPPIMWKVRGRSVKENIISLQLINTKNTRVVIQRNALNKQDPVAVYYDVDITHVRQAKKMEFYKMRKERDIQGNETFQDFIFRFFSIPHYTYEGENGQKLQVYFQNIMPLFVVHQNAWSDIQSSNPQYNIPDIKRLAFQILMNLSDVQNVDDRIRLRDVNNELKQKRQSLDDVSKILTNTVYRTSDDLTKELNVLNDELRKYQQLLSELEQGGEGRESNGTTKQLREKYRKLAIVVKRYDEQINQLNEEIAHYDYYINKILNEIEKIDKLKTAKKLISVLPIDRCPHCLSEITVNEAEELDSGHCSLCGSELSVRHYANDEQLVGYLHDERKDFERLRAQKQTKQLEMESKLFLSKLDLQECREELDDLEKDYKPSLLSKYHLYSREIGRVSNSIKNIEKDRVVIDRYDGLKKSIDQLANEAKQLNKRIASSSSTTEDERKLTKFEIIFKRVLVDLDFLKDGFDGNKIDEANDLYFQRISLDKNDYKPKIEGRNLYNITSSSGLIRIILAYYLALVETCMEKPNTTNHPLILILDEPRQQNLDIETFRKFTNYLIDLTVSYPHKFQVIFASGDTGTLRKEHTALDLGKTDYLIQHN